MMALSATLEGSSQMTPLARTTRYLVPRVARSAVDITVLDAVMLGTFVGTNTLLTVFSLRGSLMQITVINMMLLFRGGRTNFIADYFGRYLLNQISIDGHTLTSSRFTRPQKGFHQRW